MSLLQVNLKDEKYLEEYSACVSRLPLDELYEILDIVKKDASPERIRIVVACIQKMDDGWKVPKWLSEVLKTRSPEIGESRMSPASGALMNAKKNQPEEDPFRKYGAQSLTFDADKNDAKTKAPLKPFKSLSNDDYNEIRKTVGEIVEKAKRGELKKEEKRRAITPGKAFRNWLFWSMFLGFVAIPYIRGGEIHQRGGIYILPKHSLAYVVSVVPFLCFVFGCVGAACSGISKKNALNLGTAAFLMGKSLLGLLSGCYLGLFLNIERPLSSFVSPVIFTFSFLFALGIFLQKKRNLFFGNSLILLIVAVAVEQMGWLVNL